MSRGAHKIKGGFDLQFDDILNCFPGFFSGSYTFRSLASFAGGRPNGAERALPAELRRRRARPARRRNPNIHEYSFFVQDEWQVGRDLTVNLGLRYDLMKTAAPPVRNPDAQLAAADIDTSRLDTDTNNWGPRLGVAWAPARKPLRRCAAAGACSTAARRRSCSARRTRTTASTSSSLTFTGDAVPTYPQQLRLDSGGRHGARGRTSSTSTRSSESAAAAGERRRRMAARAATRA